VIPWGPFWALESGVHGCVGIRKVLKAVSQVLDGRVGDHGRSCLRCSYMQVFGFCSQPSFCCCLLLQYLIQNCALGGEEDRGHVL
jgi:hypothetical protein